VRKLEEAASKLGVSRRRSLPMGARCLGAGSLPGHLAQQKEMGFESV
jgi:hypothetical protein